MIHSVVIAVKSSETILLSRFYGAAERASTLLQAQWIQTLRDATRPQWGLAHEGGGEQVAVCQDKYVVYSGTTTDDGRPGDLLCFVSGTDEYDELALLEIVQALFACLRGALLPNAPRGANLTESASPPHSPPIGGLPHPPDEGELLQSSSRSSTTSRAWWWMR